MITSKHRSQDQGMTLVELISTIGIVAVLASVVTPSFQNFLESSKLSSSTNTLHTTLSLARQNAITSGVNTYVCELSNNNNFNSCNTHRPFNAIWNEGWLVFQDNNHNTELDKKDTILIINRNNKGVGVIFNQRGKLRFRSDGSARSAGFYLCTKKASKHILLLYTGRARVKNLSDQTRIQQCQQNI